MDNFVWPALDFRPRVSDKNYKVIRIMSIRFAITGLLAFLCFVASARAQNTASLVPGIDDLPTAQYPEGDPRRKTQPSPNGGGGGEDGTGDGGGGGDAVVQVDERFPLIRGIKVEADKEYPHSVRISWEVDPASDTAIYVGRYIRPLSTRRLVLEAENLTSPPLGPKENSYLDRNVPDGAYYYVVVTTFEMSKRDDVRLKPEVNYTTKPIVIFRKDEEEKQEPGAEVPEVRNLTAINAANSVKLNWSAAGVDNAIYNVYRSDKPLDTPNSLDQARRIGVVRGGQLLYEDLEPVQDQPRYYGVTVSKADKEYRALTLNRSYIAHTFQRKEPISEDNAKFLPDALTAFLAGADAVTLLWTPPEADVRDLRVYRSGRPITSEAALNNARFLGRVKSGETKFRDTKLRPGTYYYAVMPRTEKGELRFFEEGRTFTGWAVTIFPQNREEEEQKEVDGKTTDDNELEFSEDEKQSLTEPALEYIAADANDDSVSLEWNVVREDLAQDYRLLLYRGERPMRTYAEVQEWGRLVSEFPAGTSKYRDIGLDEGAYYYAILLELEQGVQRTMVAGRNYTRFPARIGGRETDDGREDESLDPDERREEPNFEFDGSLDQLNRILAETYFKEKYTDAVRRIEPFTRSTVPRHVRARALLYTGLSYYHMKRYRVSLDYFLQESVRQEYPERSSFWYDRTIKKLD